MTSRKPDQKISRRTFTKAGFGIAGLVIGSKLLPLGARADHHETGEQAATPELVTDIAGNEMLLSQVKYLAVSEVEGQQCGSCALLIQREGDYGRCGLFQQGQVPVAAWCTSYIKKPGS